MPCSIDIVLKMRLRLCQTAKINRSLYLPLLLALAINRLPLSIMPSEKSWASLRLDIERRTVIPEFPAVGQQSPDYRSSSS